MSVAMTHVDNVKVGNETYVTGSEVLDVDEALIGAEVIAIAATVQAIALSAFDKDKLESLYLLSDQNITLTLTLGTGTLVIALLAGIPWRWTRTYIVSIPNPFTYDFVSCTVANASGVAANLVIRGGISA